MPKKQMPVAERQQETAGDVAIPPGGRQWITGRIPDPWVSRGPGPYRVLTWAGEPLKNKMQVASGTEGQVGHMTGYSFSTPAVAMGTLNVNGPEDKAPDWDASDWDVIDWRAHE